MKKVAALTILLALINGVCTYADDEVIVDPSKYKPLIKLSSNSTVEVRADRTEELIIELKNVGTGRANNLFIQGVPGADDPFSLSMEVLGGSDILQVGVTKRVKLTVAVEKDAPQKVYPVKFTYSYSNDYKDPFESTDTINIKVVNPSAKSKIKLYNFSMTPERLNPGQTGELTFNYMNQGTEVESYLRIALDGLDTETVTVPGGLGAEIISDLYPNIEGSVSFKIRAADDLKGGSYPIKILTTVKNADGESAAEEEVFYVGVTASQTEKGNAVLDVINIRRPTQTYAVGKTFNLGFELKNPSMYKAENVLVKVIPMEGNYVVPTSQSMIMTRVLSPGQTKSFSFDFAATSAAKSQNYPITITIEYDSNTEETEGTKTKISFSQYFGVNIYNPEIEKEEEKNEEKDETKNIPKIIISSYSCDPNIVKAGSEFELSMTFMNSHAEKLVKNIKVSLTVTDKDDKQGASIFSPVNASNTIYIDQIRPKDTVSRSIDYYAIPDAQPQNYSINVNFEYEDADGKQIKAEEIVGINVSQPPSVETSEITIPEFSDAGMPVFISFDLFNTGKVTVNNLKVSIEGDVPTDNKTIFIGNLDAGSQESYEAQILPSEAGELTGAVVISYDSTTGDHFEIVRDFNIQINEPPPMNDEMTDFTEQEPTEKKLSAKAIGIAAIALLALGGGGFAAYKIYRKKKAGNDFYE